MFEKFFGFTRTHDEDAILTALLDHSKIDAKELHILSTMIHCLIKNDTDSLNSKHEQIKQIHEENIKIFESVSDNIIQSNFDFQKQYDLLRVQQRIDAISGLIIASAKHLIIVKNIGAKIPEDLSNSLKLLSNLLIESHEIFLKALQKVGHSRKDTLQLIHSAEELKGSMDSTRSEALEKLFLLANQGELKMGDFSAMEGIIRKLETTSEVITFACTSLDWLLLN